MGDNGFSGVSNSNIRVVRPSSQRGAPLPYTKGATPNNHLTAQAILQLYKQSDFSPLVDQYRAEGGNYNEEIAPSEQHHVSRRGFIPTRTSAGLSSAPTASTEDQLNESEKQWRKLEDNSTDNPEAQAQQAVAQSNEVHNQGYTQAANSSASTTLFAEGDKRNDPKYDLYLREADQFHLTMEEIQRDNPTGYASLFTSLTYNDRQQVYLKTREIQGRPVTVERNSWGQFVHDVNETAAKVEEKADKYTNKALIGGAELVILGIVGAIIVLKVL